MHGLLWQRPTERRAWLRRGAMVLLLALIALRPGIGEEDVPTRTADLEVVVALDRTTSMSALDWRRRRAPVRRRPQRPRRARRRPAHRAVHRGHASAGAWPWSCPPRKDESLIEDTLALLRREQVYAGVGSRLDRPVETLTELLTQMAERNPDRPRLVVLMADGENTDPRPQTLLRPGGRPRRRRGGARLRHPRGRSRCRWRRTTGPQGWCPRPRAGPALSRIDEANLRLVAEQLGLPYLHRTAPGGLDALGAAWTERFREAQQGFTGADTPVALELAWLLALVLLVLVVVEVRRQWLRLLHARRSLP